MKKPENIDQYIAACPASVQALLQQLRETIQHAAPEAIETISYGMPAFKMNKVLVYFAAYKQHIGFYPTGVGIAAFESKLGPYKWSKGAVQFPLDQPLPLELIAEMVRFKVKWDAENA
ncbi:MAG: DUF1801 domain-containing protein [Lewinellaceae bacterium]|nr:DUF1801 domain-containing protein [Lewinellaceae bacterium]